MSFAPARIAANSRVERPFVLLAEEQNSVQRQMKCVEEDWCLNREWTRIHTNSGSDSV